MMTPLQKNELEKLAQGKIEFDSDMSKHSSFRTGGRAEVICFADEIKHLERLISFLQEECIPFMVIGKGSNILVKDKGIRGAVIILKGRLAEIEDCAENKERFMAGAGAPVAELLRYCVRKGLAGLEFMAGIPGTAGGAVVMNAGAHGHEFSEFIDDVWIVNGQGNKTVMEKSRICFTYRGSSIPLDSVVYGVTLKLKNDDGAEINKRIMNYLQMRKETQPWDFPSCGSVFRNPEGDYAGRLIEKAGLKGQAIGGAMISAKHANYIVNTGGATSSHILLLMELAKNRVNEKFGIELIPEVRVVGE